MSLYNKEFTSFRFDPHDLRVTLVCAISENVIRYCSSRLVGLLITITYMVLLYGTYVPDWEYQISGPGSMEKTFSVSSIFTFSFFMLKKMPRSITYDDEMGSDELKKS